MDKKKVKEHIQRALVWIDPMTTESANYETAIEMAAKNLEFAMEELSKSDWVSVEDGLPEFNKEVLVTSKENPNGIWLSYRPSDKRPVMDKNGFSCPSSFNITHWIPIEIVGGVSMTIEDIINEECVTFETEESDNIQAAEYFKEDILPDEVEITHDDGNYFEVSVNGKSYSCDVYGNGGFYYYIAEFKLLEE